MRAVFASSAVNVFFVLLFAGCKGTSDQRTEILFWGMGREGEEVAKLMPEFERRNPTIKVKVQMIPWNAAHEKLLTAYAGQSLPDMCQLGNTWVPEFQLLNAIENLNPWIDKSAIIKDSSYFAGIWDTNVLDSVVYGIPWYVDTRVMFYRSDLLAKVGYSQAPKTWDEWFDVSRKLVDQKAAEFAILLPTNNEFAPQIILGLQAGSTLLKDNDTYADFSNPKFREALTVFHSFFTNGWASRNPVQFINIYQGMADAQFAMYISGPWNIGEFSRRLPPELQHSWMTAPIPGPDGNVGISLAGGSSLVMFTSSKKKDAVWKLIEYLSEPGVQTTFYHLTGDLPARAEAWNDTSLANNKYAAAFFQQLNHVKATPKIPEWEQIAQTVRQITELLSMDRLSVDEAAAELDRTVNIMLEKRRWMVSRGER
jgi:multiple sugar transport system substrate-binding protein